jgi:D-amino-acid dehydrogenase
MTTAPRRKTIGVIGAGIIGVQLARALQRKGVDVSLFDRNDPGTGTSFGNAGYLATDEIFPLAHACCSIHSGHLRCAGKSFRACYRGT